MQSRGFAALKRKGIHKSRQDWTMDILIYFFSIIILFLTVYPFYYVVIISLNEGVDASFGGIYWFPRAFTIENYTKFFSDIKWLKAIGITALRTFTGTVLSVLFTTLVAYALSFRDLIGRKYYMMFLILCMYFSGGIIPYYTVLRSLKLLDTFFVYIIPGMLSLFFITIGRGFFDGIPGSLRESAKIDGASEITIFSKIIVPISKPYMATMALFAGVNHWNNWYDSTFFVRNKDLKTLPYLMMEVLNQLQTNNVDQNAAMRQSNSTTVLSVQLAAVVITIFPIMCGYPFLQKYLVTGMMVGSVKE